MAEVPEPLGQRFKRRVLTARTLVADYGNVLATMLVISAAFFGIASIFLPHEVSVALVAIAMLVVVFAYFFYLAAAFARPHDHERRFRHVVYQSAAFIVLALSLRAFGLHEAVDEISKAVIGVVQHGGVATAPMNPKSVAELAAVMILFILVEIAAFVAQDVEDARAQVKKAVARAEEVSDKADAIAKRVETATSELDRTTGQIQQLRLVASVAQLDPSVMAGAVTLTAKWSQRAPNPALVGQSGGIAQQCWRVLLRKYLEEEHDDFWPDGRLDGIPRSVRPAGGSDDYRDEDVSYFATNIGFYAKFLAELVNDLQKSTSDDQKVCIAVLTNVLPAHWWNWTFAPNEWRAYAAIDDLRSAMQTIASKGAQIDRVIAVHPLETAVLGTVSHEPKGRLWSEDLLYDMLTRWHILADRSPERPAETLDCSDDFQDAQGEVGSAAFASFPAALQNGACVKLSGARIYPMITEPVDRTYKTINHTWTPAPLSEAYERLQGVGKYWVLRVTPPVERSLDEHFDVMFIGIGPDSAGKGQAGFWESNNIDWGMCLLSSSDAAVETMFLSVISDQSAKKQFEWWKRKLDSAVEWEKSMLPKAAFDWATKLATAPPAGESPPEPSEANDVAVGTRAQNSDADSSSPEPVARV